MDSKIIKTSVLFIVSAILLSITIPVIASNDLRLATISRRPSIQWLENDVSVSNRSYSDFDLSQTNTNISILFSVTTINADNRSEYVTITCSNTTLITDFLYLSTLLGNSTPIATTWMNISSIPAFEDMGETNINFRLNIAMNSTVNQTVRLTCYVRDIGLRFDSDSVMYSVYNVIFPILLMIGGLLGVVGFKKEN